MALDLVVKVTLLSRVWLFVTPGKFHRQRSLVVHGVSRVRHRQTTEHDNDEEQKILWEFPGDPMVRLHASIAERTGSIPGQGTKSPQATWCGQKKKKKIKRYFVSAQLRDRKCIIFHTGKV